jgi:hypothetical protein
MADRSRIRFNPDTKEIEVEGTESFVKIYFGKLQAMLSGALSETIEKTKAVKVRRAKRVLKKTEVAKTAPAKKETGRKRISNIDKVVGLIQASTKGISTSELKEKTGLAERQIWSIVNRSSKIGKIKKVRRGVYSGVPAAEASPVEKTT